MRFVPELVHDAPSMDVLKKLMVLVEEDINQPPAGSTCVPLSIPHPQVPRLSEFAGGTGNAILAVTSFEVPAVMAIMQ